MRHSVAKLAEQCGSIITLHTHQGNMAKKNRHIRAPGIYDDESREMCAANHHNVCQEAKKVQYMFAVKYLYS